MATVFPIRQTDVAIDGLCECGCGERTPVAGKTQRGARRIAGQPCRFVRGHQNRGRPAHENTRKALLAANTGKSPSSETRQKLREAHSGERHYNWKGGRKRKGDGYVLVLVGDDSPFVGMRAKNRRIAEHRLVMAEHLGRPLYPEEVVHHINGVKDDNRIENLLLFISHSEHMTFEMGGGS